MGGGELGPSSPVPIFSTEANKTAKTHSFLLCSCFFYSTSSCFSSWLCLVPTCVFPCFSLFAKLPPLVGGLLEESEPDESSSPDFTCSAWCVCVMSNAGSVTLLPFWGFPPPSYFTQCSILPLTLIDCRVLSERVYMCLREPSILGVYCSPAGQ